MISFNVDKADFELIDRIAARAVRMARKAGVDYSLQDARMDLAACHANGNPLWLGRLAEADDFNFSHDVFGIRRHLDRETGKAPQLLRAAFLGAERFRRDLARVIQPARHGAVNHDHQEETSMGMSERRKAQRAKRKPLKESRMKGKPKSQSKYALKQRGIFQKNSPYLTGDWGVRMRKLG